jgi:anaerobic selenocysteine-containing dehydrogenase
MSATAKLAHYVVAPTMSLETPSYNYLADRLPSYAAGYIGPTVPWSQYTDAVVAPPAGSDLVAEWEFFYGVAQRMGLQLDLPAPPVKGGDRTPLAIDMHTKPTSDDIIALCTAGSRVPFEEVKRHPRGAIFADPAVVVAPKDPEWTGRLDVGNAQMMTDLTAAGREPLDEVVTSESGEVLDFRLVSRRLAQTYNSSGRALKAMRRRPYNPAFMHPDDLDGLGLRSGDIVEIRSARSSIYGIVEPDDSLRRGLVSMTHAFGDAPEHDAELRTIGASTGRLLTIEQFQPYTGQPQMSNIPVSVTPVDDDSVLTSRGS